jgi:hypothetical protein
LGRSVSIMTVTSATATNSPSIIIALAFGPLLFPSIMVTREIAKAGCARFWCFRRRFRWLGEALEDLLLSKARK